MKHPGLEIRPISCLSRRCIDSTHHESIDSCLKELKICARRLQAALRAQTDEARILERLYYKGKNQHRNALFWRSVIEIRRFCGRLSQVHLGHALDVLRWSFFDDDVGNRPPKGAWTQYPDAKSINSVLSTLAVYSKFLEKMHSRLGDAYRSFTLAMQSGSFLQLIITLIAISSRMSASTVEILGVLQKTSVVIRGIVINIQSWSNPSNLANTPQSPAMDFLGSAIPHQTFEPWKSAQMTDIGAEIQPAQQSLYKLKFTVDTQSSSVEKKFISRVPSASRVVIERKGAEPSHASGDKLKKVFDRKRPKGHARDEIDDIFGP